MAMASFSNLSTSSFSLHTYTQSNFYHCNHSSLPSFTIVTHHGKTHILFTSKLKYCSAPIYSPTHLLHYPSTTTVFSIGNGGGSVGNGRGGRGGGGGDGGEEEERKRNREEAMMVLAEAGRSPESFPADLAAAVAAGRVPGSIMQRFFELEKSDLFRYLLNFGGFKERLWQMICS